MSTATTRAAPRRKAPAARPGHHQAHRHPAFALAPLAGVGATPKELLPTGAGPRLGVRGPLRPPAGEGHPDPEAGHAREVERASVGGAAGSGQPPVSIVHLDDDIGRLLVVHARGCGAVRTVQDVGTNLCHLASSVGGQLLREHGKSTPICCVLRWRLEGVRCGVEGRPALPSLSVSAFPPTWLPPFVSEVELGVLSVRVTRWIPNTKRRKPPVPRFRSFLESTTRATRPIRGRGAPAS